MRQNSRFLYVRGYRSINFWREGLEFSLRDVYPVSILFYSRLFSWEVLGADLVSMTPHLSQFFKWDFQKNLRPSVFGIIHPNPQLWMKKEIFYCTCGHVLRVSAIPRKRNPKLCVFDEVNMAYHSLHSQKSRI